MSKDGPTTLDVVGIFPLGRVRRTRMGPLSIKWTDTYVLRREVLIMLLSG